MTSIIVPVGPDGRWSADLGALGAGNRPIRIRSRSVAGGGGRSAWRDRSLSIPAQFLREATWDFDFINQRAWIENVRGQGVAYDLAGMLGQLTFTRASAATYFDSAGVLQDAANNALRFDHDPVTLAPRGILIGGARTNSIRNPRCEGAVPGTPGTPPTHWDIVVSGSGITLAFAGTGVEDGIEYVDIDVAGIASGSPILQIRPETTTGVVAASGQTWTHANFARIVSGAAPGGTTSITWIERTSGGTSVTFGSTIVAAATSAALRTQRIAATRTLSGGGTVARLTSRYDISIPNGATVSFRLRIGLPKLEQGAFASSPIRPPVSSPAATTRATDVLTAAVGGWFNPSEGTFVASFSVLGLRSDANQYAATIDDGTISNQFRTLANNVTGVSRSLVTLSGGQQASLATGSVSPGVAKTVAFAWRTNDAAAVEGGGSVQSDNSVTLPTGMTTVRFGCEAGGGAQLFGHLRRVSYIPRRVSNAELQALSA